MQMSNEPERRHLFETELRVSTPIPATRGISARSDATVPRGAIMRVTSTTPAGRVTHSVSRCRPEATRIDTDGVDTIAATGGSAGTDESDTANAVAEVPL